MSPDDPRHGSYAGAVAHWFDNERPCNTCAPAEWRYRKQRILDAHRGTPRRVPALGTLRRIQALHAIGHTGPEIAAAAGLSIGTLRSIQHHASTTVHRGTAEAVTATYDRMSMTRPNGRYSERARRAAERKGWPPPLAWDNPDDPDEQPTDWQWRERSHHDSSRATDLDPSTVARILGGDWHLPCTPAEKVAVIEAWQGSLTELEKITGWRVHRYTGRAA